MSATSVMALTAPANTKREVFPTGEFCITLPGLGPEAYERVRTCLEDVRSPRLTYYAQSGDLELIVTGHEHEEYGELLGLLVIALARELGLALRSFGMMTWKTAAGEFQPDKWFYVAKAPAIRNRAIVPGEVPPPDLAIEVEISRKARRKLQELYRPAGVPEVWRFDGKVLRIALLRPDGTYADSAASAALLIITPAEMVEWIRRGSTMDDPGAWDRALRGWIRTEVAPRVVKGEGNAL
jgi:Uma2 family endonuclease